MFTANSQRPTENTDVKSYPGIHIEETTRLLEQYPAIIEGYKLIILHLGTNNLLSRDENTKQLFSVTNIHNLYLELSDMILNINPDCVIISSAILPRERDPHFTFDKLTKVNGMLEDSFGERFVHTDHGFIDLDAKYPRFKLTRVNATKEENVVERFVRSDRGFVLATKWPTFKLDMYRDGLHLSDKGKTFLCDIFRQVVINYTVQSIQKMDTIDENQLSIS